MNNKQDDLKRIYELLSLVPGGLTELPVLLENFITQQGLSAIECHCQSAFTDPTVYLIVKSFYIYTQIKSIIFKVYVHAILDVYQKYDTLTKSVFHNNTAFLAALGQACTKFINNNAVTQQAKSSSKSPNVLAKYCDKLLTKSPRNLEGAQLENALNQVVSICIIICYF